MVPVVLSEIKSSLNHEPNLEVVSEQNVGLNTESEEVISLEIKASDKLDESSTQLLATDDELIAAWKI